MMTLAMDTKYTIEIKTQRGKVDRFKLKNGQKTDIKRSSVRIRVIRKRNITNPSCIIPRMLHAAVPNSHVPATPEVKITGGIVKV